MAGTLPSLFREKFRIHFIDDGWSSALHGFLSDQKIENAPLRNLLENDLAKSIASPADQIEALHKLICGLMLAKSSANAFEEFFRLSAKKALLQNCWDGHPLICALEEIIFELIPDLRQTKKTLPFSFPPYFESHQPMMLCELSSLYALLGTVQNNEDLKAKSRELAYKLFAFLDHEDLPFSAFGSKSSEHSEWDILIAYYLMAYSCSLLLEEKALHLVAEKLWQKIREAVRIESMKVPTFAILLIRWMNGLKIPSVGDAVSLDRKEVFFDPSLAAAYFKDTDLSCYFTFYGNKTSLGAIHGKSVRIVAIGPQLFPLSDPDGFGVARSGTQEQSTDIQYQKTEDGFYLRGWTKLVNSPIWLELMAEAKKASVEMTLQTAGVNSEKVGFSFYLRAKSCLVGEKKVFRPRSLERYCGKAVPVLLEGEKDSLMLKAQNDVVLHLIPLAGKGFFWDADFLIAYEMDNSALQLTIS